MLEVVCFQDTMNNLQASQKYSLKRLSPFSLVCTAHTSRDLSGYAEKGIDQIVEKFENEKKVLEASESRSPAALFAQLLAASGKTEQIPVAQFRNIMASSVDSNSLDEITTELDQNKDGNIGKSLIGTFS